MVPHEPDQHTYTEAAASAAAREYREGGWSTIPLKIRSKAPKLPKDHEFLERRATDKEFKGFKFRNVGIVTGKVSGIIVLDDDDDGETIKANGWHVPATPTVRTKRGHQYYFACPEAGFPTFDVVAGNLEVRADRAYVVAPPSIHPDGDPYEWVISPDEAELADPPPWLIERARLRGRRMRAEEVGETIPNGSRNKTLFSLAGTLRRRGLDEASIYAALVGINETKCETPLDDDELRRIAQSIVRYEPAESTPSDNGREAKAPSDRSEDGTEPSGPASEAGAFNLTDLGNAERFVERARGRLLYCPPWRTWLYWDRNRWVPNADLEAQRIAHETARAIHTEAADEPDTERQRAISKWALASQDSRRRKAMIEEARPYLQVDPDALDADPHALNVANGTIDLRTGELRAHAPEDLITKLIPHAYDPEAPAPRYEKFLRRILPAPELRSFMQRALGYAAQGVVYEDLLVILYGSGDNGKTTLVGAMLEALGDYAIAVDPDLLMVKPHGHPTERMDLFGKRFVACSETEEGRRLAEARVKALTSRDPIRGRRMREDSWQFDPTHTTFLSTNDKPEIRGTGHAMWRRLRLVPFDVKIPEAEKDKALPEKLRREMPGILAWIVGGTGEYHRVGLGTPERITKATEGYRDEMDVLGAFIAECCVVDSDATAPATPLYETWREWCKSQEEESGSQRRFGERLRARGYENFKYDHGPHKNRKGWRGIGLLVDEPPPTDGQGAPSGGGNGPGLAPEPPASGERVDDGLLQESTIDKPNSRGAVDPVDLCRPKSYMNALVAPREESYLEKRSTRSTGSTEGGNSSHERFFSESPLKPSKPSTEEAATSRDKQRGGPRRRELSSAEVARVQRLVAQGMSPRWARMTVLGEDAEAG